MRTGDPGSLSSGGFDTGCSGILSPTGDFLKYQRVYLFLKKKKILVFFMKNSLAHIYVLLR